MQNQNDEEQEDKPLVYRPMTEGEADLYADAIADMQRHRWTPANDEVLVTFIVDATEDESDPQEWVKSYPCKKGMIDPVLMSLAVMIGVMGKAITLIALSEAIETGLEESPIAMLTSTSACPNYDTSIVGTKRGQGRDCKAVEDTKALRAGQLHKFWTITANLYPEYRAAIEANGGVFVDEDSLDENSFGGESPEGSAFSFGGGDESERLTSFDGFDDLSSFLSYLTENDLITDGDEE